MARRVVVAMSGGVDSSVAAPEVIARGDRVLVHYVEPQPLVAQGQAAVFYEGDRVLGGGVVASSAMDGKRRVDG